MKKFMLFLIVASFTCMSCGNDDDNENQDPIIGEWTYYKAFIDGVEQPLTTCETQEMFVFNTDGTVLYQYYEEDEGVCSLEVSISGTWSSEANSTYTITIEGDASSEQLTFEDNTFYFEYTDISDPLDPVIVTYREVYIKN